MFFFQTLQFCIINGSRNWIGRNKYFFIDHIRTHWHHLQLIPWDVEQICMCRELGCRKVLLVDGTKKPCFPFLVVVNQYSFTGEAFHFSVCSSMCCLLPWVCRLKELKAANRAGCWSEGDLPWDVKIVAAGLGICCSWGWQSARTGQKHLLACIAFRWCTKCRIIFHIDL